VANVDASPATVIDAWPSLPESVRTGIVAIIRAASGRDG